MSNGYGPGHEHTIACFLGLLLIPLIIVGAGFAACLVDSIRKRK